MKIPHWIYRLGALVGFFIAAFMLWADERSKAERFEAEVAALRADIKALKAEPRLMFKQPEGAQVRHAETVPSVYPEAPYAIEMTITVDAPASPFGILITCNKKPFAGHIRMAAGGVIEGISMTHVGERKWQITWREPPITPANPAIITVACAEPFSVVSIQRVVNP